jgi:hypothetical protein
MFILTNNKLKIKNTNMTEVQIKFVSGINVWLQCSALQFYEINFGHSQVLFMGSVPRINRLLTTVSRTIKSLKIQKPTIPNRISCVVLSCRCVTSKLLIISNLHHFWWCTNIFYIYDKLSKGVPIVSNQLPYSLKLVKSYPIISNSKAA